MRLHGHWQEKEGRVIFWNIQNYFTRETNAGDCLELLSVELWTLHHGDVNLSLIHKADIDNQVDVLNIAHSCISLFRPNYLATHEPRASIWLLRAWSTLDIRTYYSPARDLRVLLAHRSSLEETRNFVFRVITVFYKTTIRVHVMY